MTAPPSPLPPKLILQTLNRGDGLLGLRPHGTLGPRGDRVSLLRLARWPADPAALELILAEGSAKAAEMAAPTLEGAYRALGLPR